MLSRERAALLLREQGTTCWPGGDERVVGWSGPHASDVRRAEV